MLEVGIKGGETPDTKGPRALYKEDKRKRGEMTRAVERRGKNDAAGESNGGDRVSKSLNAAWGGRDAGGTGLDKMVRQSIEKADMPVKEALGGTGAGTSIYKAIGFLSLFFRLFYPSLYLSLSFLRTPTLVFFAQGCIRLLLREKWHFWAKMRTAEKQRKNHSLWCLCIVFVATIALSK